MAARPRERGPRLTGKRTSELFQEVVFPYLDDALSLARWLTGNIADAEDVVQEVCVRAFAAIGAAKITNPRAWILIIVRNTAFTWLAKNRPKSVVVTDDERLFEQARTEMIYRTEASTPEAMLIKKSDAEMLQRAIHASVINRPAPSAAFEP